MLPCGIPTVFSPCGTFFIAITEAQLRAIEFFLFFLELEKRECTIGSFISRIEKSRSVSCQLIAIQQRERERDREVQTCVKVERGQKIARGGSQNTRSHLQA